MKLLSQLRTKSNHVSRDSQSWPTILTSSLTSGPRSRIPFPVILAISNLSPCPLALSDQKLAGPTYVLGSSYPQLHHLFRIAQRIVKLDSLSYREILGRPILVLHYTLSFSRPSLFNDLMVSIVYWTYQGVNGLMKNQRTLTWNQGNKWSFQSDSWPDACHPFKKWLCPLLRLNVQSQAFCQPCHLVEITCFHVNPRLNRVNYARPDCIEPSPRA